MARDHRTAHAGGAGGNTAAGASAPGSVGPDAQRAATRASARRRSGRAARDDKRAAILAAGMGVFSRYGYRRTSMDEIAREAGIAKGTVYLYFATKEALFQALSQAALERVLADARAAAASAGTPEDRLVAVLDAKFGFFHEVIRRSPHAGELIDSKNRLSGDGFARADAAYRRILAGVVEAAVRRGEIDLASHGVSAREVGEALFDGGHGVEAAAGPDVDATAFRSRLRRQVRVVLAGLVR